MIGVFDSGVGGLIALRELKRLNPSERVIYLADRRHAPYGIKTREEIIHLTNKNIKILRALGAERVLIACCTASTVWQYLSDTDRRISLPIITPAASAAAAFGDRIGVIATDYTVNSHAFRDAIYKISHKTVYEIALQELVRLVEEGNSDGRVTRYCKDYLTSATLELREKNIDTLILGCTHFSHLAGEFSRLMPEVKIVNPARLGAIEMIKGIKRVE